MVDVRKDGVYDANEEPHRVSENAAKPQRIVTDDALRDVAMGLDVAEMNGKQPADEQKTFGRTSNGTVFTVPHTEDMVSQLFSPTQPKNFSDILVVLVLVAHGILLYLLPQGLRIPVFAFVFLFWRACYNGGIGYLLYQQSKYGSLVRWATKSKIFENPSTGQNAHPMLWKILKQEMETKIVKDYTFEDAPIEYNTWLLFRRVVDLILMCDFTSYCLFAIACGGRPTGEHSAMTAGRWIAGLALVLFNLWVKLDAHRVVKDFAWYWGDFFYLIDQELTFDGVFEMAPHPMYSVGYAGFYGISLIAASYKVLFISIVAHAAQFIFLSLVENPHIEKTYNPPPPRKRTSPQKSANEADLAESHDPDEDVDHGLVNPVVVAQPTYTRDLIGFVHFDLHRVTDLSAALLQLYLYAFAVLTPSTILYQTFFVVNAALWRLWYSLVMGYILHRQSDKKVWTRHFIKYGETTEEAWRQWKGIYQLSMTMCYASLVTAAFKMYTLPPDWEYGMVLFRHIIGSALISLQVWTAFSIYKSLGEFGWYFGDFFFERGTELTYSGIYRFLNNPERVLGLAGVWGLALITWSKAVFFLALLSHGLSLCFIQFVERPHMAKRYGRTIRQHSGVSKALHRSLPRSIQHWQGRADRVLEETADFVDEFIESARLKFAAGVDHFVKDTKALFKNYPARISITRLAPDLAGFDCEDYSVEFEGTQPTYPADSDKASGREGNMAQKSSFLGKEFQPIMLEYGAPIKVRWMAPLHHSKKDWIGLYMIADNTSRDVTRISSHGRWIATTPGVFDSPRADQGILVPDHKLTKQAKRLEQDMMTGEIQFAGDKLWWTTGVFEFRYHHDGKHNVMAISKPFEIRIGRFNEEDAEVDANGSVISAVEQALLPLVRNCFDRDPDIAPNEVEEAFGTLVERDGKFAKRVVFAVGQMFGIDFAPEVVQADGNVRNLAWRICNAKKVLAPYSMTYSNGRTTPTNAKE